jgi:cob(I)alamin adenosyltransferase
MSQKPIRSHPGDDGTTCLLFGKRVSKTDPRCEALGALDEAQSAMGLARTLTRKRRVRELLVEAQRGISRVCVEVAAEQEHRDEFKRLYGTMDAGLTRALDEALEALSAEMEPLRSFVLPGGSRASAALDVARTVVRRAERQVVALKEQGLLENQEPLRYMNRLSELMFALARYEDSASPRKPRQA